ncbi:hypothetical protein J1N35_004944 [Gossypium stocksii]|uniref:Uncharacterized protein n=1 Tax=Gossypium stocksii TaxID=47602 RepID=A0A9D3WBX9_9ROSI|nr:hypothetical protein J1N35_004944 [Gossypium stocksii]
MQNFQDYLPELKSNILLHAQVIGGPFDARKVNFDSLSHLTGAQLGFDIHFPSRLAWEEFVEEWKNLNRFFLANSPVETSVAPIVECERDEDEEVEEEEDTVNPDVASVNC